MYFPLFITRMDTQKPGQILPTYSALQLAVKHMPVGTDRQNIKNTASHIIHIHTDFHPMVLSWE